MSHQPVSLDMQLAWAAHCVQAVVAGRSLAVVLTEVPAGWRPGVQALVFHALRHWGQATVLMGLLSNRPPASPVAAVLGVALTLLLPSGVAGTNAAEPPKAPVYPPHTVVDQAVQALAKRSRSASARGFVNACLRRYLREQAALCAQVDTDAVARWNHPFWWVQRLRRDHPQHWQAVLRFNQYPAPMVLRVNRRKAARNEYLQQLKSLGMPGDPLGDDGVVLFKPQPAELLPGWSAGWVSVQDGAAQLAAPLLLDGAGLAEGARVLDACAAPGGKTAHLLERADLHLTALEMDPLRCERIHENLRRLELQAEVRVADAGDPRAWWDGQPFDAILLDAPCTASGIVRRHPDVRWLRRPSDVDQLAAQQRRLLDALWPLLRPGGRLLYCTCSVFRAEGEGQAQAFMARHPEARRLPAPGHMLPGGEPSAHVHTTDLNLGQDSFYYALFVKPGG